MAGVRPPAGFERQPLDIEIFPRGVALAGFMEALFQTHWDLGRTRAGSAIRADVTQRNASVSSISARHSRSAF
jgi:hypothetical protein